MTARYMVYHWDTFDNTTVKVSEADTIEGAEAKVRLLFSGRLSPDGADRVDIVSDEGRIMASYRVK